MTKGEKETTPKFGNGNGIRRCRECKCKMSKKSVFDFDVVIARVNAASTLKELVRQADAIDVQIAEAKKEAEVELKARDKTIASLQNAILKVCREKIEICETRDSKVLELETSEFYVEEAVLRRKKADLAEVERLLEAIGGHRKRTECQLCKIEVKGDKTTCENCESAFCKKCAEGKELCPKCKRGLQALF